MATCWINGEIVDAEHASVSVYDHGLLYGDGVFEGLRFYANKVFFAGAHINRLFESAKAIALSMPYSKQALLSALETTVANDSQAQGYPRVVVTRGKGTLGIDPKNCATPTVFIIADALNFASQEIYQRGARIISASTRRTPIDCLDPRTKSLNYLNNILARIEANIAGADEAILLNHQGHITEGSSDNIFLVKDNVLFTPPTADGALEGITRKLLLELAQKNAIQTSENSIGLFDLYNADECFLTGTAVELLPVREVDGRKLRDCPGPVYIKLNAEFKNLTHDDGDAHV